MHGKKPMGNSLFTRELNVTVSGASTESKEDAVNTAFHNIRAEVAKQEDGIIIGIKPVNVHVIKLESIPYNEHFLFLFFKRKKERVSVILEVTVEVQVLRI